jgi:GDP-D-mannose 3', 5'-epimerase
MNILVTGGAGFIGSHLIKRLVSDNHNVTVLDNLERGKLEFVSNEVTFHNVDLRNYEFIKNLFKNQDCVVHLASRVGGIGTYVNHPSEVFNTNIEIDRNVLRATLENNIEKYFYASSAHIYPKELQTTKDSPKIKESDAYPANCELSYGWAKLVGEKQLEYLCKENKNFKCAIARFIGIYGPNQDYNLETGSVIPVFTHRAIKYPMIPFKVKGGGTETRSYCYIDDAIECINLMIQKMDEMQLVGPLNVGKEERISISQIAKHVVEISDKDIDIEYDTNDKTLIWGQWCDCHLAKEILGWEATTSMIDGLKIVYNDITNRLN